MIERLKPYAEYKDSGLPWLGQVPAHWTAGHGFAAFREKQIKNVGLKEKRVLSLSYGRIVVKPEGQRGLMPDSFETYQIVDPGDIIIRSTDLQNDKTSLRVGLVRDRGIITSAYICLKTTEAVVPEFGYQMLNTYDLCKLFYGMGSGLRQNLEWADFKRMPVFLPAHEEQAAIVRFLDHATHRLDKTIRAKRKTIALLNEQKQAIIHCAVTRGLDPDVPLKDSGIPWLGQRPAHWEVVRLGRVIKLTTGHPFGSSGFVHGDGVRLLRGINVAPGMVRWSDVVSWPASAMNEVSDFALRAGDVVLGMDRPVIAGGVRVAEVQECDVPSLLVQRVARIRASDRALPRYLTLLIAGRGFAQYLEPIFTGISVPHMSPSQIRNFAIPLPPTTEQAQIVEWIESGTQSLEAAIQKSEREISLLREYRTRLIADVVTGKLDVREAAARLPDTAPNSTDEPDIADSDETLEEEIA